MLSAHHRRAATLSGLILLLSTLSIDSVQAYTLTSLALLMPEEAPGDEKVDSGMRHKGVVIVRGTLAQAEIEGSNRSNVSIPDNGDWVYSIIDITGAPPGAEITDVDVHFEIVHPYGGDLVVDLEVEGSSANQRLWDREGGPQDNPTRTQHGIDSFDGLNANRKWYLYARDYQAGDGGYIDEWWIKIYYEGPTSAPSIMSVSPDPVPGKAGRQWITFYGTDFESGIMVPVIWTTGQVRHPVYLVTPHGPTGGSLHEPSS